MPQSSQLTAVTELEANIPEGSTDESLMADEDFKDALIQGMAASMGVDPSDL